MHYNWRWSVLVERPYFEWLCDGIVQTLLVTTSAWLIAFAVGVIAGSARAARSRALGAAAAAYIELFRGVPLIVQLFLWFFVLPEIVPPAVGHWLKRGLSYPEFVSAVLCLGLYTSAQVAEQVRAGITSISPGIPAAALASGLSVSQTYRLVLVPVGLRMAIPTLTSEFLALLKNSSVALTIGLLELTAQARRVENYTFQAFESFAAATTIYLLCSFVAVRSTRLVERRLAVSGYMVRQ